MNIDRSVYSDMYKDAYGFRPRFSTDHMTDAEFQNDLDMLQVMIEDNIRMEAEFQKQALTRFRDTLTSYNERFGVDIATAIRWWIEADGRDIRVPQDVESFLYDVGLPFSAWPEYQKIIEEYNA